MGNTEAEDTVITGSAQLPDEKIVEEKLAATGHRLEYLLLSEFGDLSSLIRHVEELAKDVYRYLQVYEKMTLEPFPPLGGLSFKLGIMSASFDVEEIGPPAISITWNNMLSELPPELQDRHYRQPILAAVGDALRSIFEELDQHVVQLQLRFEKLQQAGAGGD